MRPSRLLGFTLPLLVWFLAGSTFGGGVLGGVPAAQAQSSLTPPAGQAGVTAPGGMRGRAVRRHRTHRRR